MSTQFNTRLQSMEVSIKSAAELLGISRNTVYKAIEDGKISKTENGKIDSSELLRVFSHVKKNTKEQEIEHFETLKSTLNTEQNKAHITEQLLNTEKTEELYKNQIKMLEEALKQAKEREQWQLNHIDKLTDTIKLLETPKKETQNVKIGFWDKLFRMKS